MIHRLENDKAMATQRANSTTHLRIVERRNRRLETSRRILEGQHRREVAQHNIRLSLSLVHLTEDRNATTAEDTVTWQRIVQRSEARARQCAHVTAVLLLVAEETAVVVPRDFPAWLSGPKIQPIILLL